VRDLSFKSMNMINKTYKLSEVARSKIAADLRGKAGIYQ
jgi:hypothetical protein